MVLIAADISVGLEKLLDRCVTIRRPGDREWTIGAEHLSDCEVAVLRSPYRIRPGAIARSHALRLILRAGSGLDGIPTEEAKVAGVECRSMPLASRSVAEHAIGLLLAAARQRSTMRAGLLQGHWLKSQALGVELHDSTLLIVGFGRVGREVAKIAAAFGMRLLVADRSPSDEEKCAVMAALRTPSWVTLEEGMAACDAVMFCCPAQCGGAPLLDRRLLAQAGKPILVVNVGRGSLIDEAALKEALDAGRVIGAGLDVMRGEPAPDRTLVNHPRVVATPHIGAQTVQARERVEKAVFRYIKEYCEDVA
jgi:D-3-phosphoglycerate dehydrogenase